jgi:CelD/BcsL family acetyltransferase involved in cellulose biosynthesis
VIPAVARAAMDVRPLGPADHQAYDRFVAASPGNTVYHARAWHELLRRCFGYEPRVLVAWQDGAIVGTLPLALVDTLTGGRRLVSLPFSHHVAPLLRSADVAPWRRRVGAVSSSYAPATDCRAATSGVATRAT